MREKITRNCKIYDINDNSDYNCFGRDYYKQYCPIYDKCKFFKYK